MSQKSHIKWALWDTDRDEMTPEPPDADVLAEGPAYFRSAFIGVGDTSREAKEDMQETYGLGAAVVQRGEHGWVSYAALYTLAPGDLTWGTVKAIRLSHLARTGGYKPPDDIIDGHIFFEDLSPTGEMNGLPVYQAFWGS